MSDNEPLEQLVEHAPVRDFATPGAFVEGRHVFIGHETVVLQLTVYVDPRPGRSSREG